jgi:hypothetical protein
MSARSSVTSERSDAGSTTDGQGTRPTRHSANVSISKAAESTRNRSVQLTDATTPDSAFAQTLVVQRTIEELDRRLAAVMHSDTDQLPTVLLPAQPTGTPDGAGMGTEAESSAKAQPRDRAASASELEREAGMSIAPRNSYAGSRRSPRGTA